MKTKNHLALVSLLAFTALTPNPTQAQDATTTILSGLAGLGGFAIGNSVKSSFSAAPAVGAAVLPAIVNFGYDVYKTKQDEEKVKYYISGRNYERWIRSQTTWYTSTLDPYTGRPPAFSGLTSMDDGLPKKSEQTVAEEDIRKVYTIPVKVPAGVYDGVPRTERTVQFPKLP